MTRFAFLSDIHGNSLRLEHALADCEQRGVERYICLGDIVGGSPNGQAAEKCWALLRAHDAIAVKGNADINHWLPPTLELAIAALPFRAELDDDDGHRMLLVHGAHALESEFSSDLVTRDIGGLARRLRERNDRLMFFGHTHRPRIWQASEDAVVPLPEMRITLDWSDPATCYIVNVGPLNRPFPGEVNNGQPCYLYYDSKAGFMEHVPV